MGGEDVRRYDLEALRNNVAVVLQKNVLFSGTIKDNLRWGNPDATDEEMMEACRLAQADEFIQQFPNKYDTWIEQGGSNVSGGQKPVSYTHLQRDGNKEDHGQAPAHGKAHNKREDQHQRTTDGHADDHHEGHLHIHHIRGHTGNQAGHREFVDVLKGIILDAVEHVLAQVTRKTGGSGGAGVAGRDAENQR